MYEWKQIGNRCGGKSRQCEAGAREWGEAQEDAVVRNVLWRVIGVLVSKTVRDIVVAEGMCPECPGCVAAVSAVKECAENMRWGSAVVATEVGGSTSAT